MAQVKYGPLVTKIRGSLATVTFSEARSGEIVRDRTYPRDPRTPSQSSYRSLFSQASAYWNTTVSQNNQELWNALGAATTYTNSAGDPYHPSGQNLCTGANALLAFCEEAAAPDPPESARFDAPRLENTLLGVDHLGFTDAFGWAPQFRPSIVVRRSTGVSDGLWAFSGPFVDAEVHSWIELDPGTMVCFMGDLERNTTYFIQILGIRTDAGQPTHHGSISYKQLLKCKTLV